VYDCGASLQRDDWKKPRGGSSAASARGKKQKVVKK